MLRYLVLSLLIVVVYIYLKKINLTYEKNKHTKYATIKTFQSITHFPKDLRVFCLQSQMFYYLANTLEPKCFVYYHGKTNHCMYRKSMLKLLYNYGSVIICEYKHKTVDPNKMIDLALKLGHTLDQIVVVGETDACDYAVDMALENHTSLMLINPSRKQHIPDNTLVLHRPGFPTTNRSKYWPIHGNDNAIIMPDRYIYRLAEHFSQ